MKRENLSRANILNERIRHIEYFLKIGRSKLSVETKIFSFPYICGAKTIELNIDNEDSEIIIALIEQIKVKLEKELKELD